MINLLALVTALGISAVAAYYSIIGLTTIFAGAFYPILIMGSALEIGKLVTISWLYRNWQKISIGVKYYLSVCVLVLMFITSMGIFGFLSKSHIEQTMMLNNAQSGQVEVLNQQIELNTNRVADLDKQIVAIDGAISKLLEKGQAQNSLRAADQQRKNRDALVKQRDQLNVTITNLKTEKIKQDIEIKKIEAEVGPLKYIAELIYGKDDAKSHFDSAVRIVIIILILVFDPLAVVLLLGINQVTSRKEELVIDVDLEQPVIRGRGRPKKEVPEQTNNLQNLRRKSTIEIDRDSIFEIK